jgi:hypothetical protein
MSKERPKGKVSKLSSGKDFRYHSTISVTSVTVSSHPSILHGHGYPFKSQQHLWPIAENNRDEAIHRITSLHAALPLHMHAYSLSIPRFMILGFDSASSWAWLASLSLDIGCICICICICMCSHTHTHSHILSLHIDCNCNFTQRVTPSERGKSLSRSDQFTFSCSPQAMEDSFPSIR